ncbi:hypothetical protein [Neptuniibacter halophilus]|uniref:hypothetical protein n=1 Tax=Neptuniibacter halophilus TaxID=651666 RepID=UPI00257319FB|nr:hypothetical protein [Neptuniibacter halophilus]
MQTFQIDQMRTEQIQTRIEGYTSGLSQAVQSGSGAQFSMLLSLIHSNQQLMRPEQAAQTSSAEFRLPQDESVYPDPNELHNDQVVERLNTAVHDGLVGDFAYVNGYLHTLSHSPRQQALASDEYARVGLISTGQLMVDEIETSRQQIRTAA